MSNEVGRIDKFLALARKLSFPPTSLDIFDIRIHYVIILYILSKGHFNLGFKGYHTKWISNLCRDHKFILRRV